MNADSFIQRKSVKNISKHKNVKSKSVRTDIQNLVNGSIAARAAADLLDVNIFTVLLLVRKLLTIDARVAKMSGPREIAWLSM